MSDAGQMVKVWDAPLRLFHWVLVVVIAIAFLSSEEDSALNKWHVLSGWLAAILLVFRLVWGFIGGEHSRFADFIRPTRIGHHISSLVRRETEPSLGHNPLGGVAVLLLLTLIAGTVWTGAFGGEAAEDLHEIVAWVLLAMVGLHVVAVIVMSVLERENLVRAMITGDKPKARHPGGRDAIAPTAVAMLIGAGAFAGAAYSILKYDADAFVLRSPESYEHRAENGADAMSTHTGEAHED